VGFKNNLKQEKKKNTVLRVGQGKKLLNLAQEDVTAGNLRTT